jgi:hypothetical protein
LSKPQVRLDPDVAEAIGTLAEENHVSLNTAANQVLRKALGLQTEGTAPRPPVDRQTAVLRAPRGQSCPHPLSARVAGVCLACQTRIVVPL